MSSLASVPSSFSIAGIPRVHHGSHLSNFENKYPAGQFYSNMEKLVQEFLTLDYVSLPRYIFLCGSPGSGKSHFLVGLYRAMIHKIGYLGGDGATFSTYPHLAQEMISLFKERIPLRLGMQGYLQSKWLFLDDCTSSERILKEDSLEHNMLRDIMIDRYDKQYCLVISSNMMAEDLMSEMNRLMGGYIMSRANDSKVIQFPSVDFRKQK